MKRLWTRLWIWWVELFDRREPGDSLALMRILTALTVLVVIAELVFNDLVGALYYGPEYGGHLGTGDASWLVEALGGPSPAVIWGLIATTALAGVALGLGVGARVAALVAAQCLLALRGVNAFQGSYGALLSNGLWLCVLAQCDVTLSLRCRLRTGAWTTDDLVPSWPRLLGVFQLVVLYTWTGLVKVSAAWVGDFSALYFILQDPAWQRFDMAWTASVYPLTQVATGLIWVWETTFGVILIAAYFREREGGGRLTRFFKRHDLRVPYALVGVAAHLTISILMVVGPFLLATLLFYPCLFPPETWRGWGRRLRPTARD